MPLLDLSALRPPDGALLFGSLDAPRDVAEGCVEVTLTLDDHESSPRTTRACPPSTARSSRADEPSPFDADPREGASRSPKARWWRSVVGPAADPRPSPPDPDLAPLQRLDFALHLDASVGDRALLTVAAPPDPTASPCVLARHALEIVAPAQELALRLPSPDAARCDPNAVEPPGPSPAFVPVVPPLLRDVLAFVVVARWIWTRLRGERRADHRAATRIVTATDPNRRAPSSASLPPGTPPPPTSFAAWRSALDAAPSADPSVDRLVDWTLTATVARNLAYDRDRDSNPRARDRDLVAAFLAAPPRRPPGVGWREHDPAPEWDDDDDDRPEGLSGGTASTWGVSEDERNPPSASGWTTTTAGTGTMGTGTMGTVTTGTTRSTVVAGRDAASSGERALMCDEEPLGVDARARDSFDPIARRPRASRVSEDSARPLSGEGGLLVRAWGTSGDPADARRMLGDWAETPQFERATLRMFPPGTLDRATGVPRFGKGAEVGAETWSLAREGFDADEHPERDETKPTAAIVPVAVFEETDDDGDGDVDGGGIEATREGIPGRHPGYHLRGYHPTPPAASDHGITAALFEDPVAGRGTPTPAPSPAGVDHERGWWIRTRGDKSRPTPPR